MAHLKYNRKRCLERIHRKAHVQYDLPIPRPPEVHLTPLRLTILDLPGIEALERKYAADIEHGRTVADQLE